MIEIVDEIFSDWQGAGALTPAWRWALAERDAYPKRSRTTQYQESDLAFVRRLLAEEGLFCWFEHAAAEDDTLGSHTLVIADHNGVFPDNLQPTFRFTQAGTTLAEDSLERWHAVRALDTTDHEQASWDYRTLGLRPQSEASTIDQGDAAPRLFAADDPGAYAWTTAAHGARIAARQREAIDVRAKRFHAEGTVRNAAPATVFALADHADHDRDAPDDRRFLIVELVHRARNNLPGVPSSAPADGEPSLPWPDLALDAPLVSAHLPPDVPFYRNRFTAVRAYLPWRALLADGHGRQLHPRPTVAGTQTAIVVGDGAPTHTERDHRVRVQFHWQRGSRSAGRTEHPSGADNAPASDTLGTWVRVAVPVAGANWGGHFVPRPGQEVVVAFLAGDIDRPVVIGAAYNGQGQKDARGNRIAAGASEASPNAPAFFAGAAGEHAHQAALSGIRTQQLAASRTGAGGFNQLVFDDTPGEARIELSTTQYATRLQLGHLKEQADNARKASRGHGAELATAASGAVRAGSGLLVSADARPAASGNHLDSREPIAQTEDAQALTKALDETARKQNAALPGDPDTLPATATLEHAREVLAATTSHGDTAPAGEGGGFKAIAGGTGTVAAWSEPRIQFAAPAGILQLTPADAVLVAGTNLSIASGQDANLVTQGEQAAAISQGLALFTVGKATDAKKPNQETGIALHAASGQVSLQAQSGHIRIAAEKRVTVASTKGSTRAKAKQHLLATAGGAYMKFEGGNIELHAPGSVEFKAGKKVFTGPASSSASFSLPTVEPYHGCQEKLKGAAGSGGPFG